MINESDYLLTIFLWFHFKPLERFYGSNKYLSLVFVLAAYNMVMTFLVMSLGQLLINFLNYVIMTVLKFGSFNYFTTILNTVAPGPLGIVSSLYICYGKVIPISYQFKILLSNPSTTEAATTTTTSSSPTSPSSDGNDPSYDPSSTSHAPSRELILTDHFQIHIIYTLLLFNNGFKSFLPCLIGIFIGKLYCADLLPGSKHWLLPSSLFKFFISPVNSTKRFVRFIHRTIRNIIGFNSGFGVGSGSRRYQPINQTIVEDDQDGENPENGDGDGDGDDREEIVDDIRNTNDNEIRAETPVRPLASQFLDTFRRNE